MKAAAQGLYTSTLTCRYVWGQQPVAYVKAFRLVHDVLHNLTCSVVMVWAPNVATGYPWRIHDRTTQYALENMQCSLMTELDLSDPRTRCAAHLSTVRHL